MKNYIQTLLLCLGCFALSYFYFEKMHAGNPKGTITVTADTGEAYTYSIDENSPPCLQMHYSIEHHAKTYNIPLNYAYGIAYVETRYGGPFDWDYNPAQTSYAGAIGPMQIMPTTANFMWPKEKISKRQLMHDIDFNVETSMKLLRHLYDRYGDWKTVFGCYNTGRPCINDYAIKVFNHKPKFKQQ